MQDHWSPPTAQSNLTGLTTELPRVQGYNSLTAKISEQERVPQRDESPVIQVGFSPSTTRPQSAADIHGLDHGGLVVPDSPPPPSPPLLQRSCSLGANVRRNVAVVYRSIKSWIRADEGDQESEEPTLQPLPPLPRSQVPLPSDRFLANAAVQTKNAALEKELAELQEERERDRRINVKTEKQLEDHKLQLRRQCAETEALEKHAQSQKPLINLDFVSALDDHVYHMDLAAAPSDASIHNPPRQDTSSDNYENGAIEVMLPGRQGRFLISFSDPQEVSSYQLPEIAPLAPPGFGDLLTKCCVVESHNTVNKSGHGVAELEGEPSFLTAADAIKLFSWPTDPSREVLGPEEETCRF